MYKVIVNNKEYKFENIDNAMLVYADAFKKYGKVKVIDENGKIVCKKGNF